MVPLCAWRKRDLSLMNAIYGVNQFDWPLSVMSSVRFGSRYAFCMRRRAATIASHGRRTQSGQAIATAVRRPFERPLPHNGPSCGHSERAQGQLGAASPNDSIGTLKNAGCCDVNRDGFDFIGVPCEGAHEG